MRVLFTKLFTHCTQEDAPKFQVPSRVANHFWRRQDFPSQLSFLSHAETLSIVTFASVALTESAADVNDMIRYFTDADAFYPRACALKFIFTFDKAGTRPRRLCVHAAASRPTAAVTYLHAERPIARRRTPLTSSSRPRRTRTQRTALGS